MNCYYLEHIPNESTSTILNELESLHAAASRRQQHGDRVVLIDGKGTRAIGEIDSISRLAVKVRIVARTQTDNQEPRLILATALPKGEGLKTMLSMIAQLGVTTFVPLACERSIVKVNNVNVSRWERIFREACKQSHNPVFPKIEQSASPVEFVLTTRRSNTPVLVADRVGAEIKPFPARTAVAICIGPEGGFTDDERTGMLAQGAELFSLGTNILRIETAAVAAVSIVRRLVMRSEV